MAKVQADVLVIAKKDGDILLQMKVDDKTLDIPITQEKFEELIKKEILI